MLVWVFLLVSLVHGVELLGEPFTVIKNIDGRMQYTQQVLVNCNTPDVLQLTSVPVGSTSGVNRSMTITCTPAELTYTRSVIGYVPADVKVLASEVCTKFTHNDARVNETLNRFINAVNNRRSVGNVALTAFVTASPVLAVGQVIGCNVGLGFLCKKDKTKELRAEVAGLRVAVDDMLADQRVMYEEQSKWRNITIANAEQNQVRFKLQEEITRGFIDSQDILEQELEVRKKVLIDFQNKSNTRFLF